MADARRDGNERNPPRDLWARAESLAKILGALALLIGSVAIPVIIQRTTEQGQRTQIYMQIMSEREKADTAIRQEMFKTLLTNYLGAFTDQDSKETEVSFRKRIMFLDLLNLNFQEYLNARPLFEDVNARLERVKKGRTKGSPDEKALRQLRAELIRVSRNVASSQSTSLARFGLSQKFDIQAGQRVCVRLYPTENLKEIKGGREEALADLKPKSCASIETQDSAAFDKGRPAIEVELIDTTNVVANVRVTPFQEAFKNGTLNGARAGTPLPFEVSVFDLPYMDNTRVFDGSRFALVLSETYPDERRVEFKAIAFREEFMSLRDRPFLEEMLQRLSRDGSREAPKPWWRWW